MKTINDYAELVKEEHALNKTLAPVEDDLTGASQPYAKGAKFIYNGIMYQAKTAIAQGAALVLNTNYEAAPDVETQIANEAAARSQMGAKNLLPNKATTQTINGVTFTVNDDGSVTADGTATANANLIIYNGANVLKAGTYRLSGGNDANNIIRITDPFSSDYPTDAGSDALFTITDVMESLNLYVFLRVASGETVSNLTFKPMVRLATDSDDTYQPYAKTNKELTDDVSSQNTAIANEVGKGGLNNFNVDGYTSLVHLGVSNKQITNKTADNRNVFNFRLDALNSSGQRISILATQNGINATGNYTFDVTIPSGTVALKLLHSGGTYDFTGIFPIDVLPSDYKFGMHVAGYDCSTIGGLVVDSVFLTLKSLYAVNSTYSDYVPTNAELLSADTNAVLGAHNWFTSDKPSGMAAYTTCTKENNGVRIANSQAGTYAYFELIQNLEKNTVYTLSTDVTVTSGMAGILIKGDSSNIEFKQNVSGSVQFTFNSGNYTTIKVVLYATIGTSAVGSVLYDNFLLKLASDPSTAYAPYAMTNRELTEKAQKEVTVTQNVSNLSVDTAWGGLYASQADISISSLGLTSVPTVKSLVFQTSNATTAVCSIKDISTSTISVNLMRGTSGTVSGKLIAVLDIS